MSVFSEKGHFLSLHQLFSPLVIILLLNDVVLNSMLHHRDVYSCGNVFSIGYGLHMPVQCGSHITPATS